MAGSADRRANHVSVDLLKQCHGDTLVPTQLRVYT